MKKLFIITLSLIVSSLTFQSCTTPVDNTAAFSKIDSLATGKMMAYTDSIKSACMTDVMAKATLMADSMMNAAMKKPASTTKKSAPKPPAPPANAKSDKMSGSSTTATQEKKDKMDNTTQSTTEKKKDKMSKGTDPNPKF